MTDADKSAKLGERLIERCSVTKTKGPTAIQRYMLEKMAQTRDGTCCCYQPPRTMEAMARRGWIRGGFEHETSDWRITDAGRKAIGATP